MMIDSVIIFFVRFFGYRIIPVATPWMATHDSLESQPETLQNAPFFYGLDGIMGAGGLVSAFVDTK